MLKIPERFYHWALPKYMPVIGFPKPTLSPIFGVPSLNMCFLFRCNKKSDKALPPKLPPYVCHVALGAKRTQETRRTINIPFNEDITGNMDHRGKTNNSGQETRGRTHYKYSKINEGMTRHTWNQIRTMRTGTERTIYGHMREGNKTGGHKSDSYSPLLEGASRAVQHPMGTLEASRDKETGQTASRAVPVLGPTVEQGAREAMVGQGNWEAMAGLDTRVAMADLETQEAMAGLPPRPRPQPQPPPGLYGWSHTTTPPPPKKSTWGSLRGLTGGQEPSLGLTGDQGPSLGLTGE